MTAKPRVHHDDLIVEQFTKQAVPFGASPAISDGIERLVMLSHAGPHDDVLNVACGPGLVACAFARVTRRVTGIDITEAMIDEARRRQHEAKLTNMTWRVGRVDPLPYDDCSFSCVITRYSFHHFVAPEAVLREMVRVCKPGGLVLVADMSGRPEHMDALNRMERLRDPSHVRALSADIHAAMFASSGLHALTRTDYRVRFDLDAQLAKSFPNEGDEEKVREMFREDLTKNSMGLNAREEHAKIMFEYFVNVCTGRK